MSVFQSGPRARRGEINSFQSTLDWAVLMTVCPTTSVLSCTQPALAWRTSNSFFVAPIFRSTWDSIGKSEFDINRRQIEDEIRWEVCNFSWFLLGVQERTCHCRTTCRRQRGQVEPSLGGYRPASPPKLTSSQWGPLLCGFVKQYATLFQNCKLQNVAPCVWI